jgi:hypothetical protein
VVCGSFVEDFVVVCVSAEVFHSVVDCNKTPVVIWEVVLLVVVVLCSDVC